MTDLVQNQIERQFDRAAKSYDQFSGLQQKMADRLTDWIKSIVADQSGSVVDLGCGTGYAISQLSNIAEQGSGHWSFWGLDLSAKMLEQAKLKSPTARFVQGDLQQTGFVNEQFDLVFSNAAIQWCEIANATNEVNRILKPQGKFCISTFSTNTLVQWRDAFAAVEPNQPSRVHTFLAPDEIKNAFSKANLHIEKFEREQFSLVFQTVKGMFDSIKKLGATNASKSRSQGMLGRKKYQEIESRFRETLKKEGRLELTFDCVFVFGSTSHSN